MIAVDTSTFIAYMEGEQARDTAIVDKAALDGAIVLPPVCITEIMSTPGLPKELEEWLLAVNDMNLSAGYWSRAGRTRAHLLKKGLKARVADTLIAQACIDSGIPLITRDKDFRHFANHCDLELL